VNITRLHGITSRKTMIFDVTVGRRSYFA
jgi:hypothetical protein